VYDGTNVFTPEEGSLILADRNVEILDFKWLLTNVIFICLILLIPLENSEKDKSSPLIGEIAQARVSHKYGRMRLRVLVMDAIQQHPPKMWERWVVCGLRIRFQPKNKRSAADFALASQVIYQNDFSYAFIGGGTGKEEDLAPHFFWDI